MNKYNFILFSLIFLACPKIDPPDDKKEIELTQSSLTLSLESQWTTSLKIKATVLDTADSFTFELLRNDSIVGIYTVENTPRDTILSDGPLTPSSQYQYHAFVLDGDNRIEYSDTLISQTKDTTSHDFVWSLDTLGEYSSWLNDVWIVSENDIWVVGKIRTNEQDTAVNTPYTYYNAAHWDGNEWELIGIYNQHIGLSSIHYFSENDIWVTSYCFPYHWNGEVWTQYHLENMGVADTICVGDDIWGTSSSNIYFVGLKGGIVHYDGSEFVQIEIETNVNMIDIDGTPDGEYAFITGVDFFIPAYTTALQIHQGNVETLYYSEIGHPDSASEWGKISSVSVLEDTVYFVTWRGLWKKNIYSSEWIVDPAFSNYGYRNMLVKASNDIFMVGGGGNYNHFNGASWDINKELYDNYEITTLYGDTYWYGSDLIAITGYFKDGSHSFIAFGRR